MKICWDNLIGVTLTRAGNFYKGTTTYIEKDSCVICGENYLMDKYNPTYKCSLSCSRKGSGNSMFGKQFFGSTNHNFKGGVKKKGLPLFNTYDKQINDIEATRRDYKNKELLEVKCTYCGKWFIPTTDAVQKRIKFYFGRGSDEGRLYCSDGCKKACPTFGQMKYPKGYKPVTSREVQPELRKLVLKRDNYTCQRCGDINSELHCHHIDPVINNPIESADVDNCITYCKKCHIIIHKENKNCINKC